MHALDTANALEKVLKDRYPKVADLNNAAEAMGEDLLWKKWWPPTASKYFRTLQKHHQVLLYTGIYY